MYHNIFRNILRHARSIALGVTVLAATCGTNAQQLINNELLLRKLLIAESAITTLYVDTLSEDKIVEEAVKGMLKTLDPHSGYTPAKDVKALTEPLEGNFEGIGVQFNMVEDTLMVIQPVSGGPSEKVGIIAGDKIVLVNDTAIAGVKMSKEKIMKRLRGPKDTKVRLGVIRQGIKDVLNFTVVRDKIPVFTIDAAYMIDETVGYIKISSFGATTHNEFKKALGELRSQGMKNLVLDLQSNGGGYLQAAVDISNEFLEKNELIVFTEGRMSPRKEYRANGNGIMKDGKVVVLIDSYTASASEIVSGAIQDNDRGLIAGRRSFAKGLVQRPVELPDGSLIRLTTAHYYSPSGRCIQKPYVMGGKTDYDKDITDRLNSGELTNVDSIHFADSLMYKTLKLQRTVYGGGGIMPDFYVPLDTTKYTRLHRELVAKSCIINTTLKYVDRNRKHLKKEYKDFTAFNEGFQADEELLAMLRDCADKANVTYTDSTLTEAMPAVKIQLKALIARDLWDMKEYYMIQNQTNDIYLRGLEVMREEELKQ